MLRLLALQLILLDREGHLQQVLLLLGMHRLETGGDRRARVTAGIHDVLAVVVLGLVEQGLDTGLREAPGTGVEGFLLGPDDRLGVGVLVEVVPQLLPGEGVQLLDTRDGGIVELVLGAVLDQCGVHLTGAQDDALNLVVGLKLAGFVGRVRDDPLEVGITDEILNVRACNRMTKERLGEEDDEGY